MDFSAGWEMIVLGVTVVAMLAGVMVQIGRRTRDIEILTETGKTNAEALMKLADAQTKLSETLAEQALTLSRHDSYLTHNAKAIEEHEEECRQDRKLRDEWRVKTDDRLAEGAKNMVRFSERQERLLDDIREIKGALLER